MLFVVLPAYNEQASLGNLLQDLNSVLKEEPHLIIVVNDASTDQTSVLAEKYARQFGDIRVLNHEENKGLGGALMTGFSYVLNSASVNFEEDILITLDADNTHPADRIPLLLQKMKEGSDLAIASRYVTGGQQLGLSPFRKILSWGAGRLMTLFFPIPGVKDYSCGYRAYRLLTLKKAYHNYGEQLMESRNFAAMVELLIKVVPFCQTIAEVPLILHYERKQGKSKMKIGSTIKGYFTLIYRFKKGAWSSVEWVEE
ncbi:glycosyltransferase family 2 protein [Desulfitobacterium metallireducens]|uniref:Glycosyltransferase n=1 Tax=Desulfitobacterium metallireducens DSM 15288 TaxID=871968 RepID=W0EE14_9FIRM|nr:glycosyltransferase family 2 protein [Desulfitobacterium metallireducens]AHF07306.1 glycosyltransferase [Desulfitobacterium metallireducens DSM 15288]